MFFFPLLFVALAMLHPTNSYRLFGQSTYSPVATPSPSPSATTSKNNCSIQYEDKTLYEGQEIMVEQRLFRVEDCHLQRAYQTCGTHLWFMINIVCQAIEQHKYKTKGRLRRFAQQKLLSEACCENACTVSEMSRYCP